MEIVSNIKITTVSKDDFYNHIKNVIYTNNLEIQLVINDAVVASFIIYCNDNIIKLNARVKDASLVTSEIKRESGESMPIDDTINWFETKLNNI